MNALGRLARWLYELWKTQPTILTRLLEAVVLVLAAFGFALTKTQIAALVGLVIAIAAVLNWREVTPNVRVRARVISEAEIESRRRHPTRRRR